MSFPLVIRCRPSQPPPPKHHQRLIIIVRPSDIAVFISLDDFVNVHFFLIPSPSPYATVPPTQPVRIESSLDYNRNDDTGDGQVTDEDIRNGLPIKKSTGSKSGFDGSRSQRDFLNLTCVSGPSKPDSRLSWFINDEPVRADYILTLLMPRALLHLSLHVRDRQKKKKRKKEER